MDDLLENVLKIEYECTLLTSWITPYLPTYITKYKDSRLMVYTETLLWEDYHIIIRARVVDPTQTVALFPFLSLSYIFSSLFILFTLFGLKNMDVRIALLEIIE